MIKKYLQFIRESIKDDVEEGKFWKLDEGDIREFLVDILDEKYLVTVTFGFVGIFEDYDYRLNKKTTKDVFTVMKGGPFYKNEDELLEMDEYIALYVRESNSVKFTPKDVANFYGWEYDNESKSGDIYVDVDVEDMADIMLERNDRYKSFLVNGTEDMWDHYESHYYIPETNSFFQYSLDKENERLMIRSIIKELGGIEEVIKYINEETDNDLSNMSEDEIINFLLNERFHRTIEKLCKHSEITQEAKQIVAD